MAESEVSDYEAEGSAPKKPKFFKKKYKQKFRSEWIQDPAFKNWLVAPTKANDEPSCRVCSKKVSCSKTALQRHRESVQHKQASSSASNQVSIKVSLQKQENTSSYKETTAVQLAAFIAEHNLPLTISPSLLDLLKSRAPQNIQEAKSLQEMRLGATKCTNIIRQGVGLFYAKELVEILRQKRFSIIPDETTDVSTAKQLAMCVMYVDDDLKPVNRFLDIVEATDTGAQGLYQSMKIALQEKSIPLSNIIGFSSDTCNVMFGQNLGVATLLKKDMPHVATIKCSCHMIHLCASHACLQLSTTLEDLCRNIYAHFSRSALRQKDFEQFQAFVEVQPHKLLRLSQTRWLSLESCVTRVLEQWEALRLYFVGFIAEKKDPSYTTESILNGLNNKFVLAQLEFLSAQLRRLNEFNTKFQTTEPMLHHLREEVGKLLRDILSDFIILDVVRKQDPFIIDVNCAEIRVPLEDVYVGILATTTLNECRNDPASVLRVKQACLDFLIELIKQIRSRFDMRSPIFRLVEFLIPSNAVKCSPTSLHELFSTFPYLVEVADVVSADLEWRKQSLEESTVLTPDESSIICWQKRLNAKAIDGSLKYPNLRKVVACMLSLPFSNASVERVFSLLNLINTHSRNSLKRETLVGLMHTHEGMKAQEIHAPQMKLSAEFLRIVKDVKSDATDSEANKHIAKLLTLND